MIQIPYEELYELYINKEYSLTEIAKMFNCSYSTVRIRAIKYKIPIRKIGAQTKRARKKLSEALSMENNPSWKGGVKILKGNYIGILEHEHPNSNSQGYVPEHRLIMENHLGRYLNQEEIVHHINGDTRDNRIQNLELLPSQSVHASITERGRDEYGRFI